MKNHKLDSIGPRALTLSILVLFAGLGILGGSSIASAATAQTYNNVQIFVSPQNSTLDTFSVSAYNSTGGLVASSQSSYPAFSFELPSGEFLFAVTASSSHGYPSPGPIAYGVSQGAASSSSGAAMPVKYYNPEEYGYVLTNITSSRTLHISTSQIQTMNTTKITVTAKFLNGTAAAGTYVDASIVGGGYWYSPDNSITMSGQTGSDGVVTLQVPAVPLELTAWNWISVNLPTSQTTTQVTIGGSPVNVTVYWQPTYVGLAGSSLIIPPTTTATITMKAQQPNYWYYPSGVTGAASSLPPSAQSAGGQSSGTVANGPGAVPANVAGSSPQFGSGQIQSPPVTTQISPLPASTVTSVVTTTATAAPSSASTSVAIEGGVVAAIVIAAAGVALALRRK
jgi:hypothetical protein